MRTKALQWLILSMAVLLFTGMTQQRVFADDDTASTIRLVHYEGTVEAEGQDGSLLPLMENMRFQDGEALKTGTDGSASVSLDTERILTLASESRVEFSQKGKKLKLNLTDGELFLDVKAKLGADESLEIQTSTMAVGIRGTIVMASNKPDPVNPAGRQTTLAILEGQTEVFYTDENGQAQSMMLPAGQKMILHDADGNGQTDAAPDMTKMTAADITQFVQEQIDQDDTLEQRIRGASDVLESTDDMFAADGDWTWEGTVTLVAQSASKLYDGSPLTRPSDVLVNGLPTGFTIKTAAGGSQTDAGTGSNPVSSYAIFNGTGEEVTSHFAHIETVSGNLTVDPAPLTIWTGTASKVYDGTPLTEPETQIRTVPGYETGDPLWRDTAYVGDAAAGHETLYGVCGQTWVHGTNPLTGEIREIELPAGKKLTVILHDEDGKQSIEFRIEDMQEDEIPEEVLRLYADNPDLLEQACKDTGWDVELIRERISLLSEPDEKDTVEQSDLTIARSASEKLMQDSTNVRIHIDTDITNYNGRALGNQEAHFTGIYIDPSIEITATGSQTDVGKSDNTYTIKWGNANPNNYILQEELGTLEVTPASLNVTTGSADKIYDGEPLTSEEASLTGLVNNETASITATGTITEPGTVVNSYTINWGSAKSSNYSIAEHLGTLTVSEAATVYDDPVTLTAESVEKTYDGTALTTSSVKATGLPEGFTVQVSCEGSQTDAGSSTVSVSSYTILDPSGKDVTSQFVNVTVKSGTLTVKPAALTVTTGSAEKKYDGTPLTSAEASVTGLANGETATVTAEGSITETGSADNTYTITWGTAKESNYTITEEIGTLTVTVQDAPVTLTAASDEKTYDGTALANDAYTVEGLRPGFTVKAEISGSQTDAGSSANTVSSYTIFDASGKDVTAQFSNINTVSGTLDVAPLPVKFDLACKELEYPVYTGSPIFPEGLYGTYTDSGEEVEIDEDWGDIIDQDECLAGYIYTAHLTGGVDAIISVMGVTDAGKHEIIPKISFTPDKKSNYAITYTNNILEIAPMEITFDLGGDKGGETITYFGAPCLPNDPTMIADGENITGVIFTGIYEDGQQVGRKITYNLAGNDQVQLTYKSYKDAGTYTIKPDVAFSPESSADNYKLSYTNEKMEILKREIIIRTGSKQKVYDGEELTNNDMVPVIENLVAGESATAEIKPASIKNAGSVTNTYQNLKWVTAEEKNYTVNEELGTLTVVPVSLVLKSNCAFGYSSSITVDSWNLTVQVNNVENPARYQVNAQGDKTWQIVFYWDSGTDRIDAAIELTETATEFVFHPTYSITSGSAVNYNIITDDQSGTFDEAPYIDPDGNNSSDGTAGKLSLFAARGDDSTAVTSQANGTAEEDRKGITDTDTLPEQPAGEMKDQGTAAETDSADSGPESEEMNNKAETPNGEHAGTDNANNKTETPNAGDAQTENANKTTEISTSGVSETAVTDSGEKESSEIKEPSAIGNTIAEMKKQSETIIIAATENMMPIPQSTESGADTLEEQTEGDS